MISQFTVVELGGGGVPPHSAVEEFTGVNPQVFFVLTDLAF